MATQPLKSNTTNTQTPAAANTQNTASSTAATPAKRKATTAKRKTTTAKSKKTSTSQSQTKRTNTKSQQSAGAFQFQGFGDFSQQQQQFMNQLTQFLNQSTQTLNACNQELQKSSTQCMQQLLNAKTLDQYAAAQNKFFQQCFSAYTKAGQDFTNQLNTLNKKATSPLSDMFSEAYNKATSYMGA